MLNKVINILSTVILIIGMTLCFDVNNYNNVQGELYELSGYCDYDISSEGKITKDLINKYQVYDISIVCVDNCDPKYGDILTYELTKKYQSIILSNFVNNAKITKKVMIGY